MSPPEINHVLPMTPLQSKKIRLTPFEPSMHAQAYFKACEHHPETYRYLPSGPFKNVDELISWYHELVEKDATRMLYAVYTKGDEEGKGKAKEKDSSMDEMVGVIGLLNSDANAAVTEIGFITTFPPFCGTFVTTHAMGTLLLYLLDPPSQNGLGLRRVQWQAHSSNEASIRAAKRMGFTFEGIIRWQRVLAQEKEGNDDEKLEMLEKRNNEVQRPGRHSAVLSVCWDDWIDGGRDHVVRMMER